MTVGSRVGDVLSGAACGTVGAMAMTGMRVITTELGLVEQTPPQALARQRARGVRALLRRAPRARWRARAWGGVCSTSPSSVVITRIPVMAIAPTVPHAAPLRTSPTRDPTVISPGSSPHTCGPDYSSSGLDRQTFATIRDSADPIERFEGPS